MRHWFGSAVRTIVLILCGTLFGQGVAVAAAPLDAAGAKTRVTAKGVGNGVTVHETDGSVVKGKILAVGDESFRVQDAARAEVEIPYAKVSRVDGPGLSHGGKIGVVVGVGVLVAVLIVAVAVAQAKSKLASNL